MTVAVCYKCGSMKFGAFNPCPTCGVSPESEDDYAISLALTDHYFPKSELQKMGGQLANGEQLYIDPEVKDRFIQLLHAEGVGQESAESRRAVPVETLEMLDESDGSPRRKWWHFWKR